MTTPPLVPPLKCQGIKTKLVGEIRRLAMTQSFERWVEPFCGSCVVPFNVQPKRAMLCDTNVHIIRLYQDIQSGALTPAAAKEFLTAEGQKLRESGEDFFYAVRERFNSQPCSLDFLFLNRSCFNGVMRFNRHGKFNVPYGHKPAARNSLAHISNHKAFEFRTGGGSWIPTTFRETGKPSEVGRSMTTGDMRDSS